MVETVSAGTTRLDRHPCARLPAMTEERFEVRRQIAAAPAKIFALLCDPKGHVTIDSSGMLQSAEGDPVTKVGDEFLPPTPREPLNDYPSGKHALRVTITELEQDGHIDWTSS